MDTPAKKPRKPKETSSPQQGSLGAKLLNIRVGEMIAVEDEWVVGKGATSMERQVGALMYKSPYLAGRHFLTKRLHVVIDREAVPLLIITRKQ